MKRSLLMTVSVLALFSFIVLGSQTEKKSVGRGFAPLEHGVDY